MKISNHFTFEEFVHTSHKDLQEENAKEGGKFIAEFKLIANELEQLRGFVNRAVVINSGFRCPKLNKSVGGSDKSQHMVGEAVDFTVKDFEDIFGLNHIFYWIFKNLNYGQLILENPPKSNPWIHFGLPRENRDKTAYIFDGKKYVPYN